MSSNYIQLSLAATPTTSSPQKTALSGLSNANSGTSEFSNWLQSRPNEAAMDRRSERSGLPQEGRDLPAANSRSEIKTNSDSASAANAAKSSQSDLGPDASEAVNSRPSVNSGERSSSTQSTDKKSTDNSQSKNNSADISAKSSQSTDNTSGSANAKNEQATDLKPNEVSQTADAIEGGVAEDSVVIGADSLAPLNLDESALPGGVAVPGGAGEAGDKVGSGPQALPTLAGTNPQVMMELGTGQSDGSASGEVSQMDRSSAESQRLMAATAQGVMASSRVGAPSQSELAEQANDQQANSVTAGVQAAGDVSNGRLVDAAANPEIVELARTLSSDASSGNGTAPGSSGLLQTQSSEAVNPDQQVTPGSTVADSAVQLTQRMTPLESGSVQDSSSVAAASNEAQAQQEANKAAGADALVVEVESSNSTAQELQADADQAMTTGAPVGAAVSGVAPPQSDSSRAANGSVSNSINAPQPVGINSNPANLSANADQSGGDGQSGRNQSGEALAAALDKVADKGAAKGAEALAKAETLTPAGTSTSSSPVPAAGSSAEMGARAPASLITAVPPQALQRMQQPQWGNRLGERTLMMVQQGPRVAFVQLDPPELGALQVRVHLGQGDQVSLNFSAPNAAVRDVIEQHMPRLREMFAEQGLNLAQSDVRDQSTGGRDRGDGESHGRGVQFAGRSSDEDELLFEEINIPVGRVDYYA